MPSVIATREALADIVRLREFLRENSPQAAQRLGIILADIFDMLAKNPRLGRPVVSATGMHRLVIPFGAASYVMHYRYVSDDDSLQVLRLRHGRQARG